MTGPVILCVTLTPAQIALGVRAGQRRQDANMTRPGRYGARRYRPGEALRCHVQGALGEVAVLTHWVPELRRRGLDPLRCWRAYEDADPATIRGDVCGWEVRTRSGDWWPLILHPEDDGGSRYVLVMDRFPRFLIVGWIAGRDGKRRQWWREPPEVPSAAFFVPPPALRPLPADPFPEA